MTALAAREAGVNIWRHQAWRRRNGDDGQCAREIGGVMAVCAVLAVSLWRGNGDKGVCYTARIPHCVLSNDGGVCGGAGGARRHCVRII